MSGATAPEAETIIRQTETINRLLGSSASQIERVQRQLDGAYAAQQRYEQAQRAITAAVERGRITQERANQLLQLAQQRYQATGQAAQQFAAANDNATRSLRGSGSVISQAGFQLQDFFVQVQSGTSALTALSQQGSQFLGAFGPGGAIAGAALAIGAVVAALVSGGSEAERFRRAMENNRDAFERATQAAERWRAGLREEAIQLQELRAYYASLNRERQAYELRQAIAAQRDVEQRRAALQRDILGRGAGLSQGIGSTIFETEQLAARAYGRGSAEFSAIVNDETIQRLRDIRAVIESFRETGDVSENAIAAFSARLREAASIGGPLGDQLLRMAREMESLGQRSRDVERDTREVNARLEALGATAAQSGGQVAALADELGRLQQVARQEMGQENAQAIARARERAEAIRQGADALRLFDAEQRRRDAAAQYEQQQRAADERRLRDAGMSAAQVREEIERSRESRRALAEERARLEAQNDLAVERQRQATTAARRSIATGRREESATDRARRERDQLIASLDEEAAANIRLEESLRRIDEARRRNLLSEQEAAELSQRARERREQEIVRARDKSELYAEETKRVAQLNRELSDIIGGAFQDLVRDGKSFEDTLKNIERQLLRLGDKYLLQPLLDQLAQLALSGLGRVGNGGIGGGIGGFLMGLAGTGGAENTAVGGLLKSVTAIAATVAHTGGMIDDPSLPRRVAPAEVFLDAPRFHSGGIAGGMRFASDEVPAILRRGEMVLTERQQKAVASRGAINQTVIVQTEDPGAFMRSRAQIGREMRRELSRAARSV